MTKDIDKSNIDAAYWADNFMARFRDRKQDIDAGLMLGWFANYRFAVSDPLDAKIEKLEEHIKEPEGKQMTLRNGDIVSELEYYRLRFPKMMKAAKEATRLLNETKV